MLWDIHIATFGASTKEVKTEERKRIGIVWNVKIEWMRNFSVSNYPGEKLLFPNRHEGSKCHS